MWGSGCALQVGDDAKDRDVERYEGERGGGFGGEREHCEDDQAGQEEAPQRLGDPERFMRAPP